MSQIHLPSSLIASKLHHILVSAGILMLPGSMAWAAHQGTLQWTQLVKKDNAPVKRPFLEQGYAYLPLVWGSTLAFYLQPMLHEAGSILKVWASPYSKWKTSLSQCLTRSKRSHSFTKLVMKRSHLIFQSPVCLTALIHKTNISSIIFPDYRVKKELVNPQRCLRWTSSKCRHMLNGTRLAGECRHCAHGGAGL